MFISGSPNHTLRKQKQHLENQEKNRSNLAEHSFFSWLELRFLRVNKKITEEVATIPSKRLRNKIAGFTTHLMKRIQKGLLAAGFQDFRYTPED